MRSTLISQDEEKTYSYILPLRGPRQQIVGAMELFQQTTFLEERLLRARQRVTLVALVLVLTLSASVLLLTYLYVSRPIEALVKAVKAVGEGQLKEQIPVKASLRRTSGGSSSPSSPPRIPARARGSAWP